MPSLLYMILHINSLLISILHETDLFNLEIL